MKSLTSILTLALLLILSTHSFAQSETESTGDARTGVVEKERGKHRHAFKGMMGKRIAKMFEKLDTDGSQSLTADELGKRGQRALRFDTNKDGAITKSEVQAAIAAHGQKIREMTPEQRKAHFEQKRAERAAKFQEMDKNGDGVLSQDEAPRVVKHFDSNGDGSVTKQEIAEKARKTFKQRRGGKRGDGAPGKRGKRGKRERGKETEL